MNNCIFKLFILLSLTSFISVEAQEIEPIFTEGKVWVRKDSYPPYGREPRYFTIKVEGDTILEGKNCKVVSFYENGVKQNTRTIHDEVLYEENGRVSYWENKVPYKHYQLYPILDMSFNEGDHSETWDEARPSLEYLKVSKAFTIELFGHKRKCLGLKYVNDYSLSDTEGKHEEYPCQGYWIEGIGCTDNACLIRQIVYVFPNGYNDQYPDPALYECYDGDELIFTQEEFKKALVKAGIK